MRRLFALLTVPLLAAVLTPSAASVAEGGIQRVPQYYAAGREPWAQPFARPRGRTSAATASIYIATVLEGTSYIFSWIVIATPQTRSGTIIAFDSLRYPFFSDLAVSTKMLVALDTNDSAFFAFNLGNQSLFDDAHIAGTLNWIATDSQGTTYVSTLASSRGPLGVQVYPYGSTSPSYTITNGVPNPGLLAVDAHDNLYVSNGNDIVVFPPGATTPVRTIANGIDSPALMVFDQANRLIVYNSGSNAITIYKPKHRAPTTTITDGINGPSAIAVGPTGTLYVANFSGNDITEYDREGSTLSRTIVTDTNGPRSIVVDSQDSLYEYNLGGKHGRTFEIYTFPHQRLKPSGKPWKFLQPRGEYIASLVTTTGPAW